MPSEIKDKYSSVGTLTITLASLASSTTGVGRQSTMVDNSTTRYSKIILWVNIKLGTSPTANKGVFIHLIRSNADGTPIRSDSAGATDAGITLLNAQQIGGLQLLASPATGDVLRGEFVILDPGPSWGIAIYHDTGANLDSTGGNHSVTYIGINPEAQ